MVYWKPFEAEKIFQRLVHACCVACTLQHNASSCNTESVATSFTTPATSFPGVDGLLHSGNFRSNYGLFSANNNYANDKVLSRDANSVISGPVNNFVPQLVNLSFEQRSKKSSLNSAPPQFGLHLPDTEDLFAESLSLYSDDINQSISAEKPGNLNGSSSNLGSTAQINSFTAKELLQQSSTSHELGLGNLVPDVTLAHTHPLDKTAGSDVLDRSYVEASDLDTTLSSLASHAPIHNEPPNLLTSAQVSLQTIYTPVFFQRE